VLFANIAYSNHTKIDDVGNDFPDLLAIARSEDGGLSFQTPFAPSQVGFGHFVDQPSIDMLGDIAMAAYDDDKAGGKNLHVVTTDTSSDDTSWTDVSLGDIDPFLAGGHVIVRLRDPNTAYLAFLTDETFTHSAGNVHGTIDYSVNVVRLGRSALTAFQWTADVLVFRSAIFEVESEGPSVDANSFARPWHDIAPMDFALGNGGATLNLVFRVPGRTQSGASVIRYVTCTDVPVGTCRRANLQNFGYTTRDLAPVGVHVQPRPPSLIAQNFSGNAYQPSVVASRDSKSVGISWYQQIAENSDNITVLGEYGDGDVALDLLNGGSFVPCASFGEDPFTGDHGYGDYFASAMVPDLFFFGGVAVVTAHGKSDFCENKTLFEPSYELTDDAHIQSERW
jgi:hypothetical protein